MAGLWKISMMFLLTVCVLGGASGQETYTSGQNHCFYCPKGTMVKDHCSEDLTNSTCIRCPPLHFSDKPNDKKHCDLCKGNCPKHSKLVTDCSAKTNRECQCDDGLYRCPPDDIDNEWECLPYYCKCGDGEGEVYFGSHTKCEKCLEGRRFVNDSDPQHRVCQDCRYCRHGQVILKSCDQHNDTQCGDSGSDNASEKGPSNTDEGRIIGIVVGVVLGVALIVGIVFVCRRSRRNTDHKPLPDEERNGTADPEDL